jgi:hypothetical protein
MGLDEDAQQALLHAQGGAQEEHFFVRARLRQLHGSGPAADGRTGPWRGG